MASAVLPDVIGNLVHVMRIATERETRLKKARLWPSMFFRFMALTLLDA